MAQWYSAVAGQRQGPFTEEAFREMARSGQIAPDCLVWNETMTAWQPAATVPGLLASAHIPVAARAMSGAPLPVIPLGYAMPAPAGFTLMVTGIGSIPGLTEDPGPFMKIAGTFQGPRGTWTGPVFASPLAFYLLKVSKQQQFYAGGLLGIAIAAAVSRTDDIRTCKVCELSPAAAAVLDPRGKRQDYDVIVLPMAAVRSTKYGTVSSILSVHVGPDRFGLVTSMFRKGKVRRFLTENGWYLNQDLSPTAGQVHGDGLNRPFGEKPPRRMSMVIKVALIIVGVIILIAIIAGIVGK